MFFKMIWFLLSIYAFLNFLYPISALECIDFQCYNDERSNGQNCVKCSNVSIDTRRQWEAYIDVLVKISNATRMYDLSLKLIDKKKRGLFCCNSPETQSNNKCSISFASGTKDGLMHYGMGCPNQDFTFTDATCNPDKINGRCCKTAHCNLPNLKELKFLENQAFLELKHINLPKETNTITIIIIIFCLFLIIIAFFCFRKSNNGWRAKQNGNLPHLHVENKPGWWKKIVSLFNPSKHNQKDNLFFQRESLVKNQVYLNQNSNQNQPASMSYNNLELSCSGSGAGRPIMTRRTAATDICLIRLVGEGRFGCVWLGRWNGDNVAVKIFSSRDERSWAREKQIYQENYLRHANVLGFVTSDSRDNGIATELWLVTEFHEFGSLFEYLKFNTLTVTEAVRMVKSITNGLSYLHMEINGYECSKPPIAHRDLKSRNILVKSCGECCIGDLGLSLRMNEDFSALNPNIAGTRRYMAPEILDNRITFFFNQGLDAFKKSDIYSYSLVVWEILRRTDCPSMNITALPYELPYQNCVTNDPSVDEMKSIVCDEKIRPPISNEWDHFKPMAEMSRSVQESWFDTPASRLTAMRLKKLLADIWNNLDNLQESVPDLGSKIAPLKSSSNYSLSTNPTSQSNNDVTTNNNNNTNSNQYHYPSKLNNRHCKSSISATFNPTTNINITTTTSTTNSTNSNVNSKDNDTLPNATEILPSSNTSTKSNYIGYELVPNVAIKSHINTEQNLNNT